MITVGILTKDPMWEKILKPFCDELGFAVSGSFWLDKPESISLSRVFSSSDLIWIPDLADGVVNCAIQAVRLSRHVLFGFPISRFPDEACTIEELVKEARVEVQLGHHEHYNPAFQALSKNVSQVQYIDLKHNTGICGDDFEDELFHHLLSDIEMCIALVPDSLKKHQSHSTCIKDGLPPIINVRLEFNNGAVSTIRLDPFAGERNLEISVFQHQGILSADLFKGTVRAEFFAGSGKQVSGEVRNIWPLDESAYSRPEDDDSDFILHECLSFIRNIQNNIPSVSSLEQGCEALKIARNVYRKIFVTSE